MNKETMDELYHQLRVLNLEGSIQEKNAILGITNHLSSNQGDYTGLLRFLDYYGEKYLLRECILLLGQLDTKFERIVELGAGFGWLGRGLNNYFFEGSSSTLVSVDKRQWPMLNIIADIETPIGRRRVTDALKPGDFIVMSELLHCLNKPKEVMKSFQEYPKLVVEYQTSGARMASYNSQIAKFNCKPVSYLSDIFPDAHLQWASVSPYKIAFVERVY